MLWPEVMLPCHSNSCQEVRWCWFAWQSGPRGLHWPYPSLQSCMGCMGLYHLVCCPLWDAQRAPWRQGFRLLLSRKFGSVVGPPCLFHETHLGSKNQWQVLKFDFDPARTAVVGYSLEMSRSFHLRRTTSLKLLLGQSFHGRQQLGAFLWIQMAMDRFPSAWALGVVWRDDLSDVHDALFRRCFVSQPCYRAFSAHFVLQNADLQGSSITAAGRWASLATCESPLAMAVSKRTDLGGDRLWGELDTEKTGFISLKEIDPKARDMMRFIFWVAFWRDCC